LLLALQKIFLKVKFPIRENILRRN